VNEKPIDRTGHTDAPGRRHSRSFLVRLWREERQPGAEEASVPVRGYLRDLQTGDQRYVATPGSLAELLERFLHESDSSTADSEISDIAQSESA
jgi:hypothetical protein